MKKWKILSWLIMSFIAAQTVVFAAECTNPPVSDSSCPSDSTFYGRLRFGHKYAFDDYFYAKWGTNELWGFDAYVKEQCNYNNSAVEQEDGFFDYSSDILNRNYLMPARTQPYWIIASNEYSVYKKPAQRNDRNLLVKYNVYYTVNGGSEKTHTECKYYAISWCGDGVLDVAGSWDSWESEQCDPNDPNKTGWWDGWCSADCKPVKKWACSSTYNWQRVTTLSGWNHLCKEWTYSSFYHDTVNHKWTWKCNNSLWVWEECYATEPYCGDGIKDSWEKCDPGDTVNRSWWWNGGCDKVTCTPINVWDPLCNSQYNGQRLDSLTEWSHLCTEWTYSDFKYYESSHQWKWKCKNSIGSWVDCSAVKPYCGDGVKDPGEECDGSDDCSDTCKIMYCGDGIKNNWEECDPKDPTKAWWWPDGCNQFCEPKFNPDVSCTQTFKRILRCGKSYNFPDDFKAGWTDRWMYSFSVNFKEGSDLNGGANPTFLWTDVLKNNNMLVRAWQTMTIIDSTPKYNIKNCPTTRSYENLYIEYIVTTAGENPNGQELPNAKLSTHKECIYYAVSRCGDGVLDEDEGEECDPGSAWTSTLPDGRICNSNCKIESTPSKKWKVEVEKTLISDTKYVTKVGQELEWQIKVTALEWDVDNVWIEDDLPEVLSYVSYTSDLPSGVTMNSGQPTKSNNWLHLEWQTSWTLKEWKSIILKVKTKVEIMPKISDDYENVACAKADDVEEDCSKRIIPTHWTLTVEKKLISESKYVTKVGQELEWQIKTTAVDWDVDNVVIKDILPEILSYVSYTSDLPSGVTMNSGQPTKSDNDKTIKWQTSWTLKEWKSIILKVKTKVDIMPKTSDDYENVACAKADDVDEDCKHVPVGKGTLLPEKTLVGSKEVKKVWDLIIWKLKVTAVWWDVEDPIITDKLPPVLWYSGYMVSNYPSWITIPNPTFGTKDSLEIIEWKTTWTLKENDYIEIQLTTYAKEMPDKEYKNVLCVRTENISEICDDVPIPAPKLRIKKTFSDWTKEKTVKIWDTIEYKVSFGNKGDASATITSIKDFLPKNVEYVSSEIHITGSSNHTNNPSGSDVIYSNKKVDGVYIDIYGWITLEPWTEWYILLKWKILSDNKDNRTNFACIYLNDKKPDDSIIDGDRCDDAVHNFEDWLLCKAPEITKKSFTNAGGSTTVVCKTSNGTGNIELSCGDGATLSWSKASILTWSNISSLKGTCVYPSNSSSSSKSYSVQCKVNGETGDSCKDTVTVDGTGGPSWLSCKAPEITKKSFTTAGGSTTVVCKTSNGKTANIELSCGDGATLSWSKASILTWSNISSLTWTCVYPKNSWSSSKSYSIVCKVNGETDDKCKDKVTISGPNSSCFTAWTKVTMADGSKKNIEDIEIGEKILWQDGSINTVLGYDRPSLWNRHLWSINGSEYFVSDEHPFMTTQWWKSFNPEMTKLEIDLDTTELKVWDTMITENGRVKVDTVDYIDAADSTQLYNFVLDGNHTYYANSYLVHNKWWGSCFVAWTKVVMADGTQKNIEDVEIWEKIMWENWVNTVLGYDRPILRSRHLWSINGWEYFVSDEHPFKTTHGWKSFNPEMTKLEIDLDTTELKVWDIMITRNGLEMVKAVDYIDADYNTQLYNFVLDWDHTYHANWYLVHNKWWETTCFTAWTKVTMADGTKKNIEDVKIWEKIMWKDWLNTVLWYDRPSLWNRHLWSINGWRYFVSDEHPFMTTEWWKSFNPEMTKQEIDLNTTELKVWDIMITENGTLKVETVDYINAEYSTQLYNFILDGDHTYYADGYLVHNKWWWTTPDPIIAPMAECFDINANQLSYEQWEILPFYWNLDNLSKDDIWYLSWSFSDKVKAGEKCDENAEGLVALNSMECSYDIVDSDWIVKKIGNFPCLTEENFTVNPFYQSRLDIWKNKMCGTSNNMCYFDFTTKATKTRLWSKLNHIENFWAGWTRFGEYKIRMKKISYLRCNDGEWDSKEKSGESLCESTFMLTNPYTVQKTPSGNFKASTEALSNYRYCEKYDKNNNCLGWNTANNLLNAIAVSEYQPNKSVDDAMQKFINKYSKLAVSTGKNWLKKVPGKNIYFISQNICLWSKCTNDIKLNKPTTLVQTSWDVEIKWDVNTDNLMLLTNWKIKFTDPDSCTHRQVVKWIFYAKSWIERTPVQKNTSDRATKRCTEWWLTVKWVLIWNWLQQVMKNSRSNLNNWHHSKTAQTVMNGASVLIEYSPSVFTKSTMPPGAEDFTTALSIYKD